MYLSCRIPSRGEVQRRGPVDLSQAFQDKKDAEREWQVSGESGRGKEICRESGSMIVLE